MFVKRRTPATRSSIGEASPNWKSNGNRTRKPHQAHHQSRRAGVNTLPERPGSFVHTLAGNRRLGFLPEIAALFDALKDDAEGTVDVTVTSAAPLSAEQAGELTRALETRFGRKVRVELEVDPKLVGGAVLRAGDLVIDGSLKSKLERLAYELTE